MASSPSVQGNQLLAGLGKLRKTGGPKHDASAPHLAAEMTQADIAAHQGKMLDLNIEEWLDLIPDHTFETKYVPIDEQAAQLLVDAHEEWEALVTAHKLEHGGVSSAANLEGLSLSGETQQRIEDMGRSLQVAIEEMAGDGGGVFVKTSSRSAKDAPVFNSRLRTIMSRFLEGQEDTTNNRLFALLQAATDMLRMTSAEEVLNAFVRSQRIADDMRLALDPAVRDRFRENFVVRRWHNIAIDQEYRAFVCKGKMTAMAQYNHVLHSPRVVERGHEIMRECKAFWEANLKDALSTNPRLESYVIDFAVCGREYGDRQAPQTEDGMKIWVIELNPFASTTDGALFSWTTERELLEGTQKETSGEMVTRVQEDSKLSGVKAVVAVDWRELLDCPLADIK